MNRRTVLAGAGLGLSAAITGCTAITTTEREMKTEPLELDLERMEAISFYYDGQELGRFGIRIGAWVNVPYEFRVSAAAEDGLEWQTCTLEFAFPDSDLCPPYIYLHGDTNVPITFERRRLEDEFTTLEVQKPTDEFEFECRAEPGGSSDGDIDEIPIEMRFKGTLVDNGVRETKYDAEGSVASTLVKELS